MRVSPIWYLVRVKISVLLLFAPSSSTVYTVSFVSLNVDMPTSTTIKGVEGVQLTANNSKNAKMYFI